MRKAIVLIALTVGLVGQQLDASHLDNQIDDRLGRALLLRSCSPCGRHECRVMGMQRYSEPRCEELGGVGAPCRMWQEPENKTLHFPNSILECNDVYMQVCPCADGLVCDAEEMACREPRETGSYSQSEREVATAPTSYADENDEDIYDAFQLRSSNYPWAYARVIR